MKRSVAKFASEAEMCALFIAIATGEVANSNHRARPYGWKAYPEVWGDILMVRETDGFQVGIEAKLRLNDDVIFQAMEGRNSPTMPGPDCRAVLVPYGTGSRLHHEACQRFGIQVITITAEPAPYQPLVQPELPRRDDGCWDGRWPEMLPSARVQLPDFVPDVVAGRPAPVQLTACILERRGWLCRQDFKHLQIDHRRFLDSGWLAVVDGAWRRGPAWPDFRRQHPPAAQQSAFGRLL